MVGHLAGRDKPYRSDRGLKGLKKAASRERGWDTLDLPYGTSISDQNDRGFAAIPGAERHLIPAVATLEGGGGPAGKCKGYEIIMIRS